jgi:16S rRNA (adenine1518-N6/adenine1519-N6)-dimethyltransferase
LGRRFGQHFLARKSVLDNIALAACPDAEQLVIEIGPGRGALTEPLLERAQHVVAIEVDTPLLHYLRQKFHDPLEEGRLTLIEGDILKTPLDSWNGRGRPVIAGNLPYYITAPILEAVFRLENNWVRAVFMVQAEVAVRIAAGPGSRDYGYLSVLAQSHARAKILFPVPRGAFRPPPKVDSAVVALEPRDAAADFGIEDRDSFLKFAAACFRQKRKTLRNNLSSFYGKELLDSLPEGRLRAEQLGIGELAALHRKLKE